MKIKFLQILIDYARGKKSLKREFSEFRANLKFKNKIKKYLYAPHHKIIYPPQGLGDILYICLLLGKFKKNSGIKKVLLVVRKRYFGDLARLFSEVDEVVFISYDREFDKMHKNVLNIEHELYEKGMKWISFRINMAKLLSLSEDISLPKPFKIAPCEFDFSFKRGRTIIISPHATSCPKCVPDALWLDLAAHFKKQGFDIIFNSNDPAFKAHKCVLLSIKDTINLADEAGYFIGYRSGLCDVIAYFSSAKKIFIYPNKPHSLTSAEKYLQDATTNELCPQNLASELIYSEGLFENIKFT